MKVEKVQLAPFFQATSHFSANTESMAPFIKETGRFGLNSDENRVYQESIAKAGSYLESLKKGRRTLFLGTGEFMYLPMKLASLMGGGVSFQSTTRSPIYIKNRDGYGARYGLTFPSPEDPEVTHFVYNIPPGYYDELFLFFEREVEDQRLRPLLEKLAETKISSVKLVFCSKVRGD